MIATSVKAQSLQLSGLVNDFAYVVHPGARAQLQGMLESLAADSTSDAASSRSRR
jgi:hypothetical protein